MGARLLRVGANGRWGSIAVSGSLSTTALLSETPEALVPNRRDAWAGGVEPATDDSLGASQMGAASARTPLGVGAPIRRTAAPSEASHVRTMRRGGVSQQP